MTTRRPRRSRGRSWRGGLTVLEVVVALAILSLVASMLTGALNLMQAWRQTSDVKLAGYEAAHRIVIQYFEDPKSVKRADLPVEVGGHWFSFELSESVVPVESFAAEATLEPARVSVEDAEARGLNFFFVNRLRHVEVTVYALDDSPAFASGQRVATLSRTFDFVSGTKQILDAVSGAMGEELDR